METKRSNLALAALALGAFAIGTAELVVVGILGLIADGTGVSVGTAGGLVAAYALGISVGAPIITALTTRFGRRPVLLMTLSVFIAGNLLAAAATSFGVLLVARVLGGCLHGLFIGVASVIAAGLVPPNRRGQAISMVFGGIAAATVLGVPLGTLIGQALGWRSAFGLVIALSAVALLASLWFVPAVPGRGTAGVGNQARAALSSPVLAVLAVGMLLMGGQFTAFTYLAPLLDQVTGVSGGLISAYLLAFGVAAAAGTLLGGRLADRNATATLLIANAVVVAALAFLYLVRSSPALVVVALLVWGSAGFAIIPALQLRVITLAGDGADLAATLGASAVNAGIAAGSLIGGVVIANAGISSIVLVGAALSAVALPATWLMNRGQATVVKEPRPVASLET